MKSTKYILTLLSLFLIFSCDDTQTNDEDDVIEIVFNNEPRLDQDENGYYHLELNPLTFQTIHRLSGHIYGDGQPLETVDFNWESSHYWTLGDTVGYIVHQGLTDDLVYVSYDTTYITGFSDFIVPTINCCSYSNSEGEVNTMFGPVWTMRLDTVLISVGYVYNNNYLSNSFEIILD